MACAETQHDLLEEELFPVERVALGRAVEKRRREFITGRACARRALARLGVPAVAIPAGPHGEPQWPTGVVGSITHCAGFRASVVAWSASALAVGIDAEPNLPLAPGVLDEVASEGERDLAAPGNVDAGRLLFCAKEAVYKAWFPLTGRWLGFEDVRVSIDPAVGAFRAELLVPGPLVEGEALTAFDGRWALGDGILAATVVLPAARPR